MNVYKIRGNVYVWVPQKLKFKVKVKFNQSHVTPAFMCYFFKGKNNKKT